MEKYITFAVEEHMTGQTVEKSSTHRSQSHKKADQPCQISSGRDT